MARTTGTRRMAAFVSQPGAAAALLWRLPRNFGALAILASVILIASFSLAALPGYLARMSDQGLRRAIREAEPYARNIALIQVGATPLQPNGPPAARSATVADVEASGGDLQATMPATVQAIIGGRTVVADGPRWIVRKLPGAAPYGYQHYLQLRYQGGITERTRLVAGRLPAMREGASLAQLTGNPAAGTDILPVFETVFTPATAQEMGMQIGDRIIVVSDPAYWRETQLRRQPAAYQIVIEVVGLFEGLDPEDQYWYDEPYPLRPILVETPDFTFSYSTGLLAPEAYPALRQVTNPEAWTYQWRYFIEPNRLDQATIADVGTGLQRLGLLFPVSATRVSTGLPDLVRRFAVQRQLAISVLALAAVGLTAVAAVVLGVLAALLAERRRTALELVRSRGASTAQLAATQIAEGLLLSLPVAAIGWVVAITLLPAPDPTLPVAAAGGVALATTILLVAATLLGLRRDRGVVARSSPDRRVELLRRLIFEALTLALAIAGLVLLRRRGLAETQRAVDPYLVAVPVLLGIATGLVVLRLTPLLIRLGAPLATRGRGLVAFLGLRRLTRPVGAQLPLLAVLLAVALATLASTVQGSIARVQSGAAWQQVGADYRVDVDVSSGGAQPTLDLAGVAGVTAVAQATTIFATQVVPFTIRTEGATLVGLDLADYAKVTAGTPADPHLPAALLATPTLANLGQKENPIPALISTRWPLAASPKVGDAFTLDLSGGEVNFVVRDIRSSFPGLPADRPFVIAPLAGLRAAVRIEQFADISTRYVRAPDNRTGAIGDAARAQVPGATVASRRDIFDRARGAPLVAGVTTGFRWSLALTALLAALAVAAVAEGVARERARERAALRLLGLRERQATTLAVLELLPPIAVAGVAGGALGIALSRLLGPAIDLTVFTAPGLPVTLQPDWAAVTILAATVIGVALVAALLVGALVGRISPGQLLREGNR